MALWKYGAAILPLFLWYLGYSPFRLVWAPFSLAHSVITSLPGALSQSVSGLSTGLAPVDNDSLRSAIRNVTADADQVESLDSCSIVLTHHKQR